MQAFCLGTRIFSGKEGLKEAMGDSQRIFLVTDSFLEQSKKSAYITEILEKEGKAWQVFSEVKPDPDTETISRGVCRLLEFRPDCIVAFGGGSALDAAKGIRYFAAGQGGGRCRFIAVPTTSGTGSEVSCFAIISNREKAVKYPLVTQELLPDAAVLDAGLVCSAPPGVTAATGMDVMTHALEAYVAAGANDFTDAAAEKALLLVKEYLPEVYRSPLDLYARERMHNASCLAGMAFSNAGLGLNHGMAHTLGQHFHIPHGTANAMLLPWVLAFNAFGSKAREKRINQTTEKYARIAALYGMDGFSKEESVWRLIRYIKQLVRRLGLPESIQGAGIERKCFEAALKEMAAAALQDPSTGTNPERCTQEEVIELFRKAYDGRGSRKEGYRYE
jgi:1-propanol dehydrogenase